MNYSSKKLNKLGSSISKFLAGPNAGQPSKYAGTASAPRASQPLAKTPATKKFPSPDTYAAARATRGTVARKPKASAIAKSIGDSNRGGMSPAKAKASPAKAAPSKKAAPAKAAPAKKATPKKAAPKTFATAKKAAAPKSLPMKGTKNKPATKSLAKSQGYNDRLDESLGARKGKKTQSMKARRDESKGASKAAGKGAYNKVSTMDSAAKTARKAGRAQVAAARTAAKKTKVDTKVGRIQSRTGRKIARINKRGAKR